MTKKLKLFNDSPPITPRIIVQRKQDLEAVAGFTPTNENERKASYGIYKNLSRYAQAVEVFRSMSVKYPEQINEYQREAYQLALECGATEEPAPGGGTRTTKVKDMETYTAKNKILRQKYKTFLDQAEKIDKENEALVDMEIDDVPEPYMIKYDWLPDSVTAQARQKISFMIEIGDVSHQKNGLEVVDKPHVPDESP